MSAGSRTWGLQAWLTCKSSNDFAVAKPSDLANVWLHYFTAARDLPICYHNHLEQNHPAWLSTPEWCLVGEGYLLVSTC